MSRYIVIDDDSVSNLISKMTISRFNPTAEIRVFQSPEEGLNFISEDEGAYFTILFLDLNMQTMTGWEFLAAFENFENEIKNRYNIYMLSSSFEGSIDIQNQQYLTGYFPKPLQVEYLRQILVRTGNLP